MNSDVYRDMQNLEGLFHRAPLFQKKIIDATWAKFCLHEFTWQARPSRARKLMDGILTTEILFCGRSVTSLCGRYFNLERHYSALVQLDRKEFLA